MRYNSTERIGIYEVANIITKDFGWIFREQPIVDVGIDALMEEVIDGNPTGKFIALQIKSGEGNFYISEGKITYYTSQIHYNYWLNLDIPVILIAHLPNENTYWQNITVRNFKRVKKQLKLEIPTNQKLNKDSLINLSAIFPKKKKSNLVVNLFTTLSPTEEDIFEILESMKSIADATHAMINIGDINGKIAQDTNVLNEKLKMHFETGASSNSTAIKASFKSYSKQLFYSVNRIEKEIEIFSEFYSEGSFAFESAIIILKQNKFDFTDFKQNSEPIYIIPDIIDNTISQFNYLKSTLKDLPVDYPGMKGAVDYYSNVLEYLLRELDTAKSITERLITKLP